MLICPGVDGVRVHLESREKDHEMSGVAAIKNGIKLIETGCHAKCGFVPTGVKDALREIRKWA